jgi:hypothetical protein
MPDTGGPDPDDRRCPDCKCKKAQPDVSIHTGFCREYCGDVSNSSRNDADHHRYGRRHLVKIAAASTRRVEMLTSENLQEVFDGTNDTKELACARALCSKLLKPPGPR